MNLINKKVISKATNSEGYITGVKSDGIQVSFTDGFGSILIPFERFNDLVRSEDGISERVNEIIKNSKEKRGKDERIR